MKRTLAAALIAAACNCHAQTSITDDFTGNVLDTNVWQIALPFPESSVVATNGHAVLTSRGTLASRSEFTNRYSVDGVFRFAASDHFAVALRTDLSPVTAFAERAGILVKFSQDGGELSIQQASSNSVAILVVTSMAFAPNTDIRFRVVDDGSRIRVFVNDLNVPKLVTVNSFRAGNFVAFYNREFSGLRSEMDWIDIRPVHPGLSIYTAAVELEFLAETNKRYVLQASADFQSWSNLTAVIYGADDQVRFTNWSRGAGHLWYRFQIVP